MKTFPFHRLTADPGRLDLQYRLLRADALTMVKGIKAIIQDLNAKDKNTLSEWLRTFQASDRTHSLAHKLIRAKGGMYKATLGGNVNV